MRLIILPMCFVVVPLFGQWSLLLERAGASGQDLPKATLADSGQAVSGTPKWGGGFIVTASRRAFQFGPYWALEGCLEYSQVRAEGTLLRGASPQGTTIKGQGAGLGLNALGRVPFLGVSGEIGLTQRFSHNTFETPGASTSKDLSRTWIRFGIRWEIPMVGVHPFLAASYQQQANESLSEKRTSAASLTSYVGDLGHSQDFGDIWTFGVGVNF